MPIAVCSVCGKRGVGRLASLYWFKWSGDDSRDAWKQRFDKTHYEDVATEWLDAARAAFDADGAVQCLLCEASDSNELAQLFGTLFVPGQEAERFTITACLKHYPEIVRKAKAGGIGLPERAEAGTGGFRAAGW